MNSLDLLKMFCVRFLQVLFFLFLFTNVFFLKLMMMMIIIIIILIIIGCHLRTVSLTGKYPQKMVCKRIK